MTVLVRLAIALAGAGLAAQEPPANGPRRIDPAWHALVHATVIAAPGERIDDATVVFRDGWITSVQPGGAPPAGARVWDCTGLTVCAAFVEPHLPVDAPAPDRSAPDAHWHPGIAPQRRALDGGGPDAATRRALRKLGFAAAAIAPRGGNCRGSADVVLLEEPDGSTGNQRPPLLAESVWQVTGFDRGPEREYPQSLMGAIALLRQTLLDADWAASLRDYERRTGRPAPAHARAALAPLAPGVRLLLDSRDEHEALAAIRLGKELGREILLLGSGFEFRRLAALQAAAVPILLPLAFPPMPPAKTLRDADGLSLQRLVDWEQAPTNPRRLARAALTVALTTDKLDKRDEFAANLRVALRHGLTETEALAMLTTTPAQLLGLADRLGTIAPGRLANLLVLDGAPFAEQTKTRALWIRGRVHDLDEPIGRQLSGGWRLRLDVDPPFELDFTLGDDDEVDAGKSAKVTHVRRSAAGLQLALAAGPLGPGIWQLAGTSIDGALTGRAIAPDGRELRWRAERRDAGAPADETPDDAEPTPDVPENLTTPIGAYGLTALPPVQDLLLTGITLWTSGPGGIVPDGALLIRDGKVQYAGPRAGLPDTTGIQRLDLPGRHVTPGLIDCHSHTGIVRGVNEGTDAITSEVRIADVIDADDVGWYRELAGGLTVANQLHGSANPIGGQNSVVKLRWGVADPQQMRLTSAPGGIKFALGENVKRSNSRTPASRYPLTRMGVEALLHDAFTAAAEYAAQRQELRELPEAERLHRVPLRRDLRLEALAEVLAGERLVHCHSYRQDEILMLARLAQGFGFRLGTYQHVLEGYKVAPAIAASARGASAFSDWWAYKFEVYDAIPHNGALMREAGVVVSFNSDSNELARRLNTEAAKAVRYGSVPPAEALQFVTLNPARQLGIADRVGSLEPGKDADFVVWSTDPLSTFAVCEQTWIEGRAMFTRERDAALRARNAAERQRILQKLLAQKPRKKTGPEPAEAAADHAPRDPKQIAAELAQALAAELRRSAAGQRGDCGCEAGFDGR